MADVITRGDKGAALTHNEMDSNWQLNTYGSAQTGNYTIVQADNRTIQPYTGTGGHTFSLPDCSGFQESDGATAGTDTGDWFVTILHNGSGELTIDLTDATDSLDGNVNGSMVIGPNQAVTIAWDGDSTGAGSYYTISQSNTSPNRNLIINGGFDIWQRGTTSSTVTTGSVNFLADRIYANCAGANCTQAQSTFTPDNNSRYSLELTGASSVTTAEIATRLEAADVASLIGTITLKCQIYNETGGAFTPNLLINTPTAEDDWTGENAVLGATALQSCSDSAWTLVTYTVDISGYTDITNGIEFVIQIPSGNMGTTSDKVRFSRFKVEKGSIATDFEQMSIAEELSLCQRYYIYGKQEQIVQMYVTSGYAYSCIVTFTSRMRTAPTVAVASTGSLNFPSSDPSVTWESDDGFRAFLTANGTGSGYYQFTYTADAEL